MLWARKSYTDPEAALPVLRCFTFAVETALVPLLKTHQTNTCVYLISANVLGRERMLLIKAEPLPFWPVNEPICFNEGTEEKYSFTCHIEPEILSEVSEWWLCF